MIIEEEAEPVAEAEPMEVTQEPVSIQDELVEQGEALLSPIANWWEAVGFEGEKLLVRLAINKSKTRLRVTLKEVGGQGRVIYRWLPPLLL